MPWIRKSMLSTEKENVAPKIANANMHKELRRCKRQQRRVMLQSMKMQWIGDILYFPREMKLIVSREAVTKCFVIPLWGAEPVNIPYIFPWSVGLFIRSTRLFIWSTRLFIWSTRLFIWSTKHFLYGQLDFLYGQLNTFYMVNSTFYMVN